MVLKTYEEMEQIYKDKFYIIWYGELKNKVIDFIENNFINIEGFSLCFTNEILEMKYPKNIWAYKFLRSELWEMGFNLMKKNGNNYYLCKRNTNHKYSNFLDYSFSDFESPIESSIDKSNEINAIQIITGKTYDEAFKIFNAALKNKKTKIKESEKKTKINFEDKKESNKIINKNIHSDVTNTLEKIFVSDDCE